MKTEWLRRSIWIAGGAFVVASAAGVFLFIQGWGRPAQMPSAPVDPALVKPAQNSATPSAADDDAVLKRMGGGPAPESRPAAAPVGVCPLKLMATFVEADPKACQAIVRDAAGRQCLVGVGDVVSKFKIVRITLEGVVVNGGAGDVEIKIVSAGVDRPAAPAAPAVASAPVVPAPPPVAPAPASGAPAVAPAGAAIPQPPPHVVQKQRRHIVTPASRAEALAIHETFAVTPQQLIFYARNLVPLMAQVELAPHKGADGEIDGLKIVKMVPSAIAARRGFQEGDVVTSAYKTPLAAASQVPDLVEKILKDAPASVTVTVLRDGQMLDLVYDLH